MTMRPSYQLTKYPIGTLKEVWAISWPLMLGLFSGSLMMFTDRLYLAHYSINAMNAMAVAGVTTFLFLVFPFAISQITEVFVGRYNGMDRKDLAAKPIWQCIWMALVAWPIMSLLSRLFSSITFVAGSLEAVYFVTMLDFSPFFITSVGIMGFFIGIGKTSYISYATIVSNLINIILAPIFIFTLDMGIKGAAIATGIAQGSQVLFLLAIFLKRRLREEYHTSTITFERPLISEMLSLALPQGLGKVMELIAVVIVYRLFSQGSPETYTTATMVQSFYLLLLFFIDGIAKGATTIFSNLIGARRFELLPHAMKSAMKVHTLVTFTITLFVFSCSEWIYSTILQESEKAAVLTPQFLWDLKVNLGFMCCFFLVDGFAWIQIGHILARGDSKYLFYVTSTVHWLTYVLPVYLLIKIYNEQSIISWAFFAFDGTLMFLLFWLRSRRHLMQKVVIGLD